MCCAQEYMQISCSKEYIDAIKLSTGTCARAYGCVSQHEGMFMYSVSAVWTNRLTASGT